MLGGGVTTTELRKNIENDFKFSQGAKTVFFEVYFKPGLSQLYPIV